MQTKWVLRPIVEPPADVVVEVGGHPLVAQLLAQRGITTPAAARAFLNPDEYTPAPPSALFGLENAAQVLLRAIRAQHNILVWGDFDVDGQTSTALLVTALRELVGEERVAFYVPNRFSDGHGMRMPRFAEVYESLEPAPNLVLTCDTGITDAEAVSWAKDRGVTVVISDHHDLPEELQALTPGVDRFWGLSAAEVGVSVRRADAVLDPMLSPADSPLRTLPGVGVAFKLIQRLYELCGREGEEEALLDLVALGIVADVAQQVLDARYLLQRGLERLRTTQREGLIALMEVARVNPLRLSAESIGFQLGPRLNALGRLEDATPSIEMLSTRDIYRARQLAAMLEGLNQERRRRTRETTTEALAMVNASPHLLDANALVLAHEHWHAGIVGIVASRMVEEFGKPAILLLTPHGENARGSARSVPGVDIGAAIAACAPLLNTWGGHAGAAGVSLKPENIELFRQELSRQVALHTDPNTQDGLLLDAELTLKAVDLELVHELERLAPFGAGNPVPRFLARNVTVQSDTRFGAEGNHRRLWLRQSLGNGQTSTLQLVWFGGGDAELPVGNLDVAFTLGINRYQDSETVQMLHVALRPAEEASAADAPRWTAPAVVHDLRKQAIALEELPGADKAAWYAEGVKLGSDSGDVRYHSRIEAVALPRSDLVYWTIPPDHGVHLRLLTAVRPERVWVCGAATTVDTWESVRVNVARMCKFAIARDLSADVEAMAARIGATEAIVRQTLRWLAATGEIRLGAWTGDRVQVLAADAPFQQPPGDESDSFATGAASGLETTADEIESEVRKLIGEMAAWRTFYLREPLDAIGFRVRGK